MQRRILIKDNEALEKRMKKTDSLVFKFGLVFVVFSLLILTLSAIAIYRIQERIYQDEVRQNVRHLAEYLQVLIKADDADFVQYQKYLIENSDDVKIPADFDGNYNPAMEEYEKLYSEKYPGMTIGEDIAFDDLSPEVKQAFAVYTHEYWLSVFESAARVFGVEYAYYLAPTGEPYHMYYVLDPIREIRHDEDGDHIILCLDVYEDPEKYPVIWEVWETGQTVDKQDVFNNEYGHNYAFYSPLYINGNKMGIIAVEIAIEKINKRILKNSLIFSFALLFIVFAGSGVALFFIDKKYIVRIEKLVNNIKQYTQTKDPCIANAIEYDVRTKDEISLLSNQIAAMIFELDRYMKTLVHTTQELTETKQQANELQVLANRDSLTGIRNKTAYDEEIKKLQWEAAGGSRKFGLGMVDLNNLKQINDKYGHDKGNIAIKNLCRVVCTIFKHSPVFRIGGDEFAIILKNTDYENVEKLVEEFEKGIERFSKDESLEPWERISAAIGIALFDPEKDMVVNDVFNRADANMYSRKKKMKAAAKQAKLDEKN